MIKELILQGNLNALQGLLEKNGVDYLKSNTDHTELSSLHWAAGAGRISIVQFFLNAPIQEDPNILRMNQAAPLHMAAMQGHTDIVQLLIAYGANVNSQTEPHRYAPIHSAVFAGHLDTVKVLVEAGANYDLENYRGESPVDTAKRQQQKEVVAYLENLKMEEQKALEKVQNGLLTILNELSKEKHSSEKYETSIQSYLTDCIDQQWIKNGAISISENKEENSTNSEIAIHLQVKPYTTAKAFVLELKGNEE